MLLICYDDQGKETPRIGGEEGGVEICDAEMLDELTTSRGELKVRTVSFSEDRAGQVNLILSVFYVYLVLSMYET